MKAFNWTKCILSVDCSMCCMRISEGEQFYFEVTEKKSYCALCGRTINQHGFEQAYGLRSPKAPGSTPPPGMCCKMREKFIVGILAEDTRVPDPVDVLDFIEDFEAKDPDGRPIIHIKFCPFCGKSMAGQPRRTF